MNNLKLYSEGPNCWNGALLKSGLAHSVRFVPKGEYWFWMKSPYCQELAPGQEPQKGDLGSIFWKGQGHYHSFVFMNDVWVFSKNSPDPKYSYKVQRFEEMFYLQQQDKAKKCWQGQLAGQDRKCDFRVVFHRCSPLEKNFFKKDPMLAAWDEKLEPLEEQVFSWVAGEGEVSMEEYEQAISQLYAILLEVQKVERKGYNKLKKFRIEAMEYRVLGLILADIKIAHMIPKLYPLIRYAYDRQDQKKHHVPLNKD